MVLGQSAAVMAIDGKKPVQQADVVIEGQTSGAWLGLGTFVLPKGRKSYVEVSTQGADGAVAADAVLFVPER